MNERELDREPTELIKITLPRCVNVYGVSPCNAAGSVGSECYNCRATCQDPDNYRDTPDRHLKPDLIKIDGESLNEDELERSSSLFASFSVRFPAVPTGVIAETGGSSLGFYLGVIGADLVCSAGTVDAAPAAGNGRITVPVDQFIGRSLWLYVEIDFTVSGASTLNLWSFDLTTRELVLLGSDNFDGGATWTDLDAGGVGFGSGAVPIGAPGTEWSGGPISAYFYNNQNAPADMPSSFAAPIWLSYGSKALPLDPPYTFPCLRDVSTMGTMLNLNAADENYDPLGRRAMLSVKCVDFTHSDVTQDPYLATRNIDPRASSTFWRKWLQRQKFGKVGALVESFTGYAGQPLSEYTRRAYQFDSVKYTEDSISFDSRDILSKTEFRKAQVPAPSLGVLSADIDEVVTTFSLFNDVTTEYPAAGTVRINDEILQYTGRTFNGLDATDFTGVTRGTDGSTADSHVIDDVVQICRRYIDANISDTLVELLVDDSKIELQNVALLEFEQEDEQYLSAYKLTTLITEPTGVSELIGRMSEECSFSLWWDERSQLVRMKAIRAVAKADLVASWTYEDNIIAGSFKLEEKPKQRLNVINFYYNPKDFAGDLRSPANYQNGLQVVNGQSSLPEQYGNFVQSRDVFSIFIKTEAQANQTTSRLAIRYADIPIYANFFLDARDRQYWVGDFVTISHPMVVDALGLRKIRRWIIVEAEEVDPGHMIKYVCADVTLDGTIFTIAANGFGTFTPELFEQGIAFITNNDGTNLDGTPGARIA